MDLALNLKTGWHPKNEGETELGDSANSPITLLVLAFSFLGDGLRDTPNPMMTE